MGSLKVNKSPGFDNIHVNIIKKNYGIATPSTDIFQQSIKFEVFPDEIKIAKVLSIC